MTGSHAAAEGSPRASAAFAAYRAGWGGEAEAIGHAVLAHAPRVANRRIDLTLLFGERAEGASGG